MLRALLMLVCTMCGISMVRAVPLAPDTIIVVACRVDDLTGQPGRPDPTPGWRDLELHYQNATVECKRERADLTDATVAQHPDVAPLASNFGDWSQCQRAAMDYTPKWNERNPGWAVVMVGCPVPIVDGVGNVVGWHLPECPEELRCVYDASLI